MPLEVEVKFLLPDLAQFRRRLLDAGATLAVPRHFERNLRLDNAGDGLARQGKLLRLRQDNGVRLTYKGVVDTAQGLEVKKREEWEVEVSDLPAALAIFAHLGFAPRQEYQKYRETFAFDGGAGPLQVMLDEMPFGSFVELEGPEPAIRAAAQRLGLEWPRRILDNYLALMVRLKARYSLPFDDVTFANFAGIHLDWAEVPALWEKNPD